LSNNTSLAELKILSVNRLTSTHSKAKYLFCNYLFICCYLIEGCRNHVTGSNSVFYRHTHTQTYRRWITSSPLQR